MSIESETKALQTQYLQGVETMSDAEATRFLALLEADYGAEHRESRINALTRSIASRTRRANAEQRQKDEYEALLEASRKFRVITDGWESRGAVKAIVGDGYADAWAYEGTEIFRMYGALSGLGKHINEVLADAQKVDSEVFGKGAKE